MKVLPLSIAVLAVALPTGARAAKPRVIALPVPAGARPEAGRGAVCLGTVEDARQFQRDAKDHSIPSLRGDAASAPAEERAVVVGRRRSAFGRAKETVVLPPGDSVSARVRALLEEGLRRRGYRVTGDPRAPGVITAQVDQFWAWRKPGYWGVTLAARVGCVLTIQRGDAVTQVRVEGESRNTGKTAAAATWQKAYAGAFREFLLELDAELARNGF